MHSDSTDMLLTEAVTDQCLIKLIIANKLSITTVA